MSKIVRASQITLENHKYILSTDITFRHARIPEHVEDTELDALEENAIELTDEEVIQNLLQQAKKDADRMIEEAQSYADQQLATAQKDSETIISNAYDQAQQISENARLQGYNTGYADGITSAEEKTKDMINQALEMRKDITQQRSTLMRSSEREMVELCLSVSEKILQKHIEEDDNLIYDLVKVGLEKCLFSGTITLRVSEEDFDIALGFKNAILMLTQNVDDIVIKQEKALRPGSCVLDTQSGSVDSSVWVQYEQIRQSFEALLSERITEYDAESI